jgi:hypothetical protein
MHADNPIIMPEQVFEAALPAKAPLVVPGREIVAELLLGDAPRFACSPVVLHHDQRLCLPASTQVQASRNVHLDSVSREQGDDLALRAYLTFASKSTFKVKRFKSLVDRDTAAHQDIARAHRTEDDPSGHDQTGSKPIPVAAHNFAPGWFEDPSVTFS